MKNIFNRILQFLFVFTMLAFISCGNILTQNNADNTEKTDDLVSIKISLDQTKFERMIEPAVSLEDLSDFVLSGVKNAQPDKILGSWKNAAELSNAEIKLEAGEWSFNLTAKKGSVNYVASAVQELKKGESKTISFLLERAEYIGSGSGKITVNLDYPKDTAQTAKITLTKFSEQDDNAVVEVKTISVNDTPLKIQYDNIPNGNYLLKVDFYTKDSNTNKEIFLASHSELVIVAADHESKADRKIDNFNDLYKISFELNEGSWTDGACIPQVYSSSVSVELPSTASISRKGYFFAGWYDNPSFAGPALKKIPANYRGDLTHLTLYAKWEDFSEAKVSVEEDIQTNEGFAITITIPRDDVVSLRVIRSVNDKKEHPYFVSYNVDERGSLEKGEFTIYDYSTKAGNSYTYYAEFEVKDSIIKTEKVTKTALADSAYTMPLLTNIPVAEYDSKTSVYKFTTRPVIQPTVLPYGFINGNTNIVYHYENDFIYICLEDLNTVNECSLVERFTGDFENPLELEGLYTYMVNPSKPGTYFIYSDDSSLNELPASIFIPKNENGLELTAEPTEKGIQLSLNFDAKKYNVQWEWDPEIRIYRDGKNYICTDLKAGINQVTDFFVSADETYKYKAEINYYDLTDNEYKFLSTKECEAASKYFGSMKYNIVSEPISAQFVDDYKDPDYMHLVFDRLPELEIVEATENGILSNYTNEFTFDYPRFSVDCESNKLRYDLSDTVSDTDSINYLSEIYACSNLRINERNVGYYFYFEPEEIGEIPQKIVIPAELKFDISGAIKSVEAGSNGIDVTVDVSKEWSWFKLVSIEKDTNIQRTVAEVSGVDSGLKTYQDKLVESGKEYSYKLFARKEKKSFSSSKPIIYNGETVSDPVKASSGLGTLFTASLTDDGYIALNLEIPESNSINILQITRQEAGEDGKYSNNKELWKFEDYNNVLSSGTKTVVDYWIEKGKTYRYILNYFGTDWKKVITSPSATITAQKDGYALPVVTKLPEDKELDLVGMYFSTDGKVELNEDFIPENYELKLEYSYSNEASGLTFGLFDDLKGDPISYLGAKADYNNLNTILSLNSIAVRYVSSSDSREMYGFADANWKNALPDIIIPATTDHSILSVESTPEGMLITVYVPAGIRNVYFYCNDSETEFARIYYDKIIEKGSICKILDPYNGRNGASLSYRIQYDWSSSLNKKYTVPVLCKYDGIPKPSFIKTMAGSYNAADNTIDLVEPEINFYGSPLTEWYLSTYYKGLECGDEHWSWTTGKDPYYLDDFVGGNYELKEVTLFIMDGHDGQLIYYYKPEDFPGLPQTFCIEKPCTVTYMLNGQVYTTQDAVIGKTLNEPSAPQLQDGFVFGGWIDSNGKLFDFKTDKAKPDLTLTAKLCKELDGVYYSLDETILEKCPAQKSGKVTVPSSVRIIRENAFADCHYVTELAFEDNSAFVVSYNSLPENLTEISLGYLLYNEPYYANKKAKKTLLNELMNQSEELYIYYPDNKLTTLQTTESWDVGDGSYTLVETTEQFTVYSFEAKKGCTYNINWVDKYSNKNSVFTNYPSNLTDNIIEVTNSAGEAIWYTDDNYKPTTPLSLESICYILIRARNTGITNRSFFRVQEIQPASLNVNVSIQPLTDLDVEVKEENGVYIFTPKSEGYSNLSWYVDFETNSLDASSFTFDTTKADKGLHLVELRATSNSNGLLYSWACQVEIK